MSHLPQRNPEQVIRDISIVEMNEDDSSCEIGYVLGKNYWGRGLMTEALKAVLDFCFTQAGFQKVKSSICQSQPSFRPCHGEGWNVLSKRL